MLSKDVAKLEEYKNSLQHSVSHLESNKEELETQTNSLKSELDRITREINLANGYAELENYGIAYEPNNLCLDDIEQQIHEVYNEIALLTNMKNLYYLTTQYRLNDSLPRGRKLQETYGDNLICSFNAYLSKKQKAVTAANLQKTKELLKSKFNQFNNKAFTIGVQLNSEYLDLCLKLIQLELDKKIIKAQERERLKKERQQLREQEKLLAEAEKERKRLEEEKKAMNLAYNKALTEEERNKIVEQIQEIDKRIGDIDYRVANPKAGWVYVIESPSLQGMVKIGTSRRLNGPFERVRELSGSSLPEAFKINGFCFSDDAFELENNMHKYFAKQRVNPNKEFFYITPQEAIRVLKEEFGCDVHFVNEDESEDEEYK